MNTMLTVYIEFFLFIRLHSYLNKWRQRSSNQVYKKKKATVLFAEKEYMYVMYVFSDTCILIIL